MLGLYRRWRQLVLAVCLTALSTGMNYTRDAAAQPVHDKSPTSLCVDAISNAEMRQGIPRGLLLAIAEVESGRANPLTGQLEPWPWTVQSGYEPLYFDTKAEAVRWVSDAMARGVNSIDVGCMQISLLFHPRAFDTAEQAFEPRRNADYAAKFLHRLYASTGQWRQATGLYHSRTNALAEPYEMRVEHRLNGRTPLWPSVTKTPTTVIQLASAWQATLAPADPPQPPFGNNWSVLLRGLPYDAAVGHPGFNTRR